MTTQRQSGRTNRMLARVCIAAEEHKHIVVIAANHHQAGVLAERFSWMFGGKMLKRYEVRLGDSIIRFEADTRDRNWDRGRDQAILVFVDHFVYENLSVG